MSLLLDSLFSSVALSHLILDVFNSARPVLLTYLGLSETQIAFITTIYIWTASLTQPFFGWMSVRVGPRWLAAGGVLWMTIFFTGAIYVTGTGGLICLIIAALGSSAFHPVGTAQATLQGRALLKKRDTTSTSLFFMAGQIGHCRSIPGPRSDPAFIERSNGAIIVLLVFLLSMNVAAILLRRKFERRW